MNETTASQVRQQFAAASPTPSVTKPVTVLLFREDFARAASWDQEPVDDVCGRSLAALLCEATVRWQAIDARQAENRAVMGRLGSPLVSVTDERPAGASSTDFAGDGIVRLVPLAQGALLVAVEPPAVLRI